MTATPDTSYAMATNGARAFRLEPMAWCVAHDGRPLDMPSRDGTWPGECDNDPDGSRCDIRTDETSGVWREVRREDQPA